jgi:hypothetical protein
MLWLAHFLHRSPSELVQALHEQAQQGDETQEPIERRHTCRLTCG